jgi:hypothetical protein
MDYRDGTSTIATIKSYQEAFTRMTQYAKEVEPSCNEFNQRVVLPTQWRPVGGYDAERLRKDANYLFTEHAALIENIGDKPRYLKKGYWDYDAYFKVSWQLRIPFNIYAWEIPRIEYPDGFDAEGNPIGEPLHIPAKMVEWCSPQYLCLGEISGWGMKSWSLPDWRDKQDEILSFMDDNPILKDQYHKKVEEANKHYAEWLRLLDRMNTLSAEFTVEQKEAK